MKKKERFVETYSQGGLTCMKIFVDTETGVNYIFHQDGHSGGMTVLLGQDGKPVVTPVENVNSDTEA